MRSFQKILILNLVATPSFVFARQVKDFKSLVYALVDVANLLVPFALVLAVLAFSRGVIKYILADGPGKKNDARNYMVFSIIGFAVILSVWALAGMLAGFFFTNLNNTDLPKYQYEDLSGYRQNYERR